MKKDIIFALDLLVHCIVNLSKNVCNYIQYNLRPRKLNNIFLRHLFLENDGGGQLFVSF